MRSMDIRQAFDPPMTGTYHAVKQRSAQWFEERIGKVTSSRLNDLLDYRKDGKPGHKRLQLLDDLVDERQTNTISERFVSDAMKWGSAYEDEACDYYARLRDVQLQPCGLFEHPTVEHCAASPDRLIGADGILETKCPTGPVFKRWVKQKDCPDDYKPQMILLLECTGRQWCDFACYDPRRPEGQRMKIWRYVPSDDERHYVMTEIRKFLAAVDLAFDELSAVEFDG